MEASGKLEAAALLKDFFRAPPVTSASRRSHARKPVSTLRDHALISRRYRFGHRGGDMIQVIGNRRCARLCQLQASHAQEQQSFKSLIGRGFEIKNVSFVRGDVSENREAFIVTLQREKSVAVCFFSANAWVTLSNAVLDDPKRCDVR